MRKLDYQEVSDILTGCTILGTGGGGSLQSGLAAVEKEFGEGKEDVYKRQQYRCSREEERRHA